MKQRIKSNIIPLLLIFVSFIILLIRARYSFCWSDESFYFSTINRFYEGDSIFMHEWHPTQLFSVIALPFYAAYVGITGSAAGIILYFRVIFAVIELGCALFVFFILNKHHGVYCAAAAALLTQWYVHINIATVSYYTLSLFASLIAVLLLYDFYMDADSPRRSLKLIIAGFIFALSVLSLPTLCVPYFAAVFVLMVLSLLKDRFKRCALIYDFIDKADFINVFKYTLIGIVIPAVMFFIYLLSSVSIKDFISSIPYILSDEEHTTSLIYPIKLMYLAIYEAYGVRITKVGFLLIFASAVVAVLIAAEKYIAGATSRTSAKGENVMAAEASDGNTPDKNMVGETAQNNDTTTMSKKKSVSSVPVLINKIIEYTRPVIVVCDVALFAVYVLKSINKTGFIFTAIMLATIPLFLITRKKNNYLFFLTVIYGLTFSLVYSYSSFCDLYVLSMGHFIAAMGGIIFAADFVREICFGIVNSGEKNKAENTKDYEDYKGRKDNIPSDADNNINVLWNRSSNMGKVLIVVCCAAAVLCVVNTARLRIVNIYRDDRIENLTEKITEGPAKGLYTSPAHLEMYNDVYDVLTEYCMADDTHKNLLISKFLPFGYIISDMKVSAPTTWRNTMDSERLSEYYSINPDRMPDTILLLDTQYGSYETCGDVEKDPVPNENAETGFIFDYINENNFTEIPVKCGRLYIRK